MTQLDSVNTARQGAGGERLDSRAPPKPLSMGKHIALAWADFTVSLKSWRMWLLLGMNDIRQRYRRSRLGQFWITLAMAIQIGTLGFLYSYLFHLPVAQYLAY